MKLKCLKPYRNKELQYKPGDVIEVTPDEAAYLHKDAPGCFADVVEKQVKAPVKDKAVKSPARAKRKAH